MESIINDITVVKSAGFCFGVKRAVDGVYGLLEEKKKIALLGELIHNRQVNSDLYSKGVKKIEAVDECESGACVVIRAHGVARAVEDKIKALGIEMVDLTCPYVKKIHAIVKEQTENGRFVVIVGDSAHPEVIGIAGWCEVGRYTIVNTQVEAEKIIGEKICVVSQTTGSRENFENICRVLKENCLDAVICDTICNATKNRQAEAGEISKKCDVMLVVGGKSSSNTVKLYDICKQNCKNTFHIENFEEIPQDINYKNKKISWWEVCPHHSVCEH